MIPVEFVELLRFIANFWHYIVESEMYETCPSEASYSCNFCLEIPKYWGFLASGDCPCVQISMEAASIGCYGEIEKREYKKEFLDCQVDILKRIHPNLTARGK